MLTTLIIIQRYKNELCFANYLREKWNDWLSFPKKSANSYVISSVIFCHRYTNFAAETEIEKLTSQTAIKISFHVNSALNTIIYHSLRYYKE